MKGPTLDQLAARVLAHERVMSPVELAPSRSERSAAIAKISEALAVRARTRARRRWALPLGTVVLAGAAAAAWLLTWHAPVAPTAGSEPARAPAFATAHSSDGAGYVIRGQERAPLAATTTLLPNDDILAGANPLLVALSTGTKLDLEPGAELLMPDGSQSQIIALRRGAVTSHVAKLHAGERFVVRTTDVEVEVRGTVFRVAQVSGSCGALTQVDVTEGRVVVREGGAEHTLGPGDHWQRSCPTGTPAPSAPSASVSVSHTSIAGGSRSALPPSAPPPPSASGAAATASPPSDLDAQNALLGDAMTAKRQGQTAAAIDALDALIQRFPQSPARQTAEAERMRLLAATHSENAREAARAYLTRYPKGFAAQDAKSILEDQGSDR